jgi:hypothetical protein
MKPFTASPCDIRLTNDNMLVVSGMPAFRIADGCFIFRDKDRQRCQARGGNEIKVRIADLAAVMKAKK